MSRYLAEKQENLRLAQEAIGHPGQANGLARRRLLHLEITTRCNLRFARCGHVDLQDIQRVLA